MTGVGCGGERLDATLGGRKPTASHRRRYRPRESRAPDRRRVFWNPDDYLEAALERIDEAAWLRRQGSYALSMYISGVTAAWRLRAWNAYFDT
jgi:hypothetical protein